MSGVHKMGRFSKQGAFVFGSILPLAPCGVELLKKYAKNDIQQTGEGMPALSINYQYQLLFFLNLKIFFVLQFKKLQSTFHLF